MINHKKLEKELQNVAGRELQYMKALGINVEKLIAEAVDHKLEMEYTDLVKKAEKKNGLPTTQIFVKNPDPKETFYSHVLDWPKSEKVLNANLKALAARA